MNEYRQNAINHLKTHLGCVGYRDYLVTELEKLEQIEKIIADYGITLEIINHADDGDFSDFEIDIVREVLENE